VTLCGCFHCNLAAEYSSVGLILVLAVVNVTGHCLVTALQQV